MEQLMDYNQTANLLNVPVKTLQSWVYSGFIPYLKLGHGRKGTVRFVESDIKKHLDMRRFVGKENI